MKKIDLVVGARPNFMKAAPLMDALQRRPDLFEPRLIHTGQHYDYDLSRLFFEQLKMKEPDIYLGVGSGTQAEQTARIMIELEKVFVDSRPDMVVVFGDVNSTMAAAIVAAKLWIKLAHVEAGLRSFDNTMPEEINRIVTDRLSDLLFVTEKSGLENLKKEGIPEERIFFTGNIMIDSLVKNLEIARRSPIVENLGLVRGGFVALTLHRPSNVDNPAVLKKLIEILTIIGRKIPIVFPCHPRTRNRLEEFGLKRIIDDRVIKIIEPLGYIDFLRLQAESKFVLTDSGGVQEETTFLKIPCITLRRTTERPITCEVGSNFLVGDDYDLLIRTADDILDGKIKQGRIPDLWDGRTAERIVEILARKM